MCAPASSEQAAVDPKSSHHPGAVDETPGPSGGQEAPPSSTAHFGSFTSPVPDPAPTQHLLQMRDYQNNISLQKDCPDEGDFPSNLRTGKFQVAKEKLISYLKQKCGVLLTLAVFVIYFNIIGWICCYSVFFVSLQAEFQRSATETGWVGSLAFIVTCVCTPFIDFLLRRFSHRVICILGVITCFLALLSSSFVPQLFYLFFTFGFLYGLGSGLVFKACMDLLLNFFPDNCARVSSLVLTGATAGGFTWTPISTKLIDLYGWRNAFRITGAVMLLVSLLASSLMVRPPPKHAGKDYPDVTDHGKSQKKSKKKVLKEGDAKTEVVWTPRKEKRMACMPEAWLFGCSCLAPFISIGFFNVNLVSYATSLGYTSGQGATVVTIAAASEMGNKLLFATFVDKLPFRKVHLMTGLSLVSTVVMLSCAYVSSFPLMCVVAVGIGTLRAAMNALPFSVGMEIFGPTKTSISNTLVLFSGGLGTIISAFVIGGTYDAFGSYNVAIYICTGCLFLTGVLYFLIPLTSKLHKVTGVKVRFDEVTGIAEMVPVVEDEIFMIEEFVTVV